VLVDLGDIIVHVMQPSVRQYYNLEELWQTTPAQRRKAMEQAAAE
jgi:ribosome-associated protein